MPIAFTSEPAVLVPAFGANGAVFGYDFDPIGTVEIESNSVGVLPGVVEDTAVPFNIDGNIATKPSDFTILPGTTEVTESNIPGLPVGSPIATPFDWWLNFDPSWAGWWFLTNNAGGPYTGTIKFKFSITETFTMKEERIYVGYPSGHPLNGVWPEALAVTLRPKEASANVFLPTDVAPYLQHYFKPVPPVQGSNPYWLVPFRFAVVTSDSNGVDVVNYSGQKYATMGNQLPYTFQSAIAWVDVLQGRKNYTPNELDFAISLGQNQSADADLIATLTVAQ